MGAFPGLIVTPPAPALGTMAPLMSRPAPAGRGRRVRAPCLTQVFEVFVCPHVRGGAAEQRVLEQPLRRMVARPAQTQQRLGGHPRAGTVAQLGFEVRVVVSLAMLSQCP
jgi:hypothetical protein